MTNRSSITAVVVTYKRPQLLKRCLEAICSQTIQVDKIVVIDNCSSDETPEVVRNSAPSAHLVTLPQNIGGAGGFHIGMALALDSGADWLWLMDDDGVPDHDCLEHLSGSISAPDILVRGSLVYSEKENEKLSFQLDLKGEKLQTVTRAIEKAEGGLVIGSCNPFNGILVHRSVPEKIGLPIKEMFIWGDEVEYISRILASGYQVATVTSARFKHPPDVKSLARIGLLGITMNVTVAKDALRQRLYVRNYAYIAWRYQGVVGTAKHILKNVLWALTSHGPRSAAQTLRFCIDGIRGNWNLHSPIAKA